MLAQQAQGGLILGRGGVFQTEQAHGFHGFGESGGLSRR